MSPTVHFERFYRGVVHGTNALAEGMVGTLIDLVSTYKCPTTNIAAANITVNRAFASWWTSFISLLARHEATTMLSVAEHIRQTYVRKSKPGLSGSRCERIIGDPQSAQNGRSQVGFS